MQAKAHTKDTMNAQKMTQKLLDQTRILELENALKNAPPPPRKLTQKETLAELAPTLRAALSRGHTFESLVAVFGAEGTKISARALAHALRVPMPKGNTTANGKKIKAAAGTAALIEPIG